MTLPMKKSIFTVKNFVLDNPLVRWCSDWAKNAGTTLLHYLNNVKEWATSVIVHVNAFQRFDSCYDLDGGGKKWEKNKTQMLDDAQINDESSRYVLKRCTKFSNVWMISETACSSQTKLIVLNLHVWEHRIGYSNLTPDLEGPQKVLWSKSSVIK